MKQIHSKPQYDNQNFITTLFSKPAFLLTILVFVMRNVTVSVGLHNSDYSGNETDHTALLAIKSQLVNHSDGVLSSWNNSVHHCNWDGVICGHKHNRVTVLDLNSRGLAGTISPFIGNLSFLKNISLYNNSLYGQIPVTIGHLYRLQKLEFFNNTLTGDIPANISGCVNLRIMSLGSNKLEGKLPAGLGALSELILVAVHVNNLRGPLFEIIQNLTSLILISAAYNSFTGSIPNNIGRMRNLTGLEIAENKLSGTLPTSLFNLSSLQVLDLQFNKLEGKLPAGLGALSELAFLALHFNNLRGPLFEIIQNLTFLDTISATFNSFTGTIPNNIGKMRNLNYLGAGENQLSGTLPSSLFNLSSLQVLDLQINQLHGELPAQMGFAIPRLKELYLASNNFSGSIPISIRNLTSLKTLDLSNNSFTGRLPRDFGHFPNLTTLGLEDNHLVGDINFINTLVNCTQLNLLQLDDNDFYGIIPQSVANLSTSLTWLSIGGRLLSGTLPAGITNLINLRSLVMDNTELTGSLPYDFGKLQKLEYVSFSSNRLTGKIPDSVGNLSRLSTLYLDNNKMEGRIPKIIGNCQSLLYMNLQNNHFYGNIPSELFAGSAKFIVISLSQNNLEGSLPFEISKQINLVEFYVSNNKLSGVIPDGLNNCPSLQYLYLDGNLFHGHFPQSLTSLTSLLQIDVSRNHLSGEIPAYFAKFPLIYLNLSYNDFEGRVPTTRVFANVSGVFLDGNKKLCGGIQALHLPKCVEKKTMKRKKKSLSYFLKRVIILTVCALVGLLAMSLGLYLLGRRNKRRLISLTSMTGNTFMKVSYDMLLKATSGFSSENLLGRGSFGSVFKGILDGKMVAVKVLNLQHPGASKSFIAECKALREVRHRNLVSIITICSSIDFQRNDFRALVYEFMPNGSLERWLNGVVGNMSLAQRVDVAIDVAHALNYLHHECEIPIVHCDLKPSNILLDNDMVARVGDFGISKFLNESRHPNHSSTIGMRGTIGYAAPEYGLGSEPSTDGDVYSYGILLLEIMTGKSPTDDMFKGGYNLHIYADEALPDQVLQIVDPSLEDDNFTEEADDTRAIQDALQRREECIITLISVGVLCSNHSPHNRMKITDAISRLQSARDNLLNARRRRNPPARGA